MVSWAEGARGHGRSTGAAFLYRPDIGKHEEDWWWSLWKRAGAGGLHTRSSRFAFFFKRDGESAVEPRCRFPASAANNFLENDGSVLPPATSILPPCRPLTLGKGGVANKFRGTPAQWK